MNVLDTRLNGVRILEPEIHRDPRGLFWESFREDRYEKLGIVGPFVQDNLAVSHRGVLRGLHLQHPDDQGKLIFVLQGEIFDVAVDVQLNSPTFGDWVGISLSDKDARQVWIPPGFAHGYLVLSETAICAYKCTSTYNPKTELTIAWNDPDIAIAWPLPSPLLSDKDRAAPRLAEVVPDRLPHRGDKR